MRNSKVRARIAAGKLRLRIRDLRNLGSRSEGMLGQIGVHSVEQLRERGAVRTFHELRAGRSDLLIEHALGAGRGAGALARGAALARGGARR